MSNGAMRLHLHTHNYLRPSDVSTLSCNHPHAFPKIVSNEQSICTALHKSRTSRLAHGSTIHLPPTLPNPSALSLKPRTICLGASIFHLRSTMPTLKALPSPTHSHTDQKSLDILFVQKLHTQRWTTHTPYHLSICLNYNRTHHKKHTPPSPHSEPTGEIAQRIDSSVRSVPAHVSAKSKSPLLLQSLQHAITNITSVSRRSFFPPIRSPPSRTSNQEPTTVRP